MACGCKGKKKQPVVRRGFTASAAEQKTEPRRPATWAGKPKETT